MDERLIQASDRTTEGEAAAQHPMLDPSAPAASEETPHGYDTVVPAQTAEEVEAQYVNRAGGYEPTEAGDADAEAAEDAEDDEAEAEDDESA